MKNLLLLAVIALGAITAASAQEISKNAIGIRAGDGDGLGTEISYQRALGSNNRLELDLGYENNDDFNALKLVGVYQWVWNIDGGFNWYAGAGGGFASASYDIPFNAGGDDSETALLAAGQVGIEYSFNFPLLLSLDVRPEFYFGDFRNGNDIDIALGIRYQF
jgi:opacity protein-like surface antigen